MVRNFCENPHMTRLFILPVLLLTLLLGTPAVAADHSKGLDAYKRGDFATALREWRPLAEQGYADAQFNLGLMYEKGKSVTQDYTLQIETAQRFASECKKRNYKGC